MNDFIILIYFWNFGTLDKDVFTFKVMSSEINSMQNELGSTESSWTDDIELILKNILYNSNVLSSQHKVNYLEYKARLKYYKIPVIIFSAVNSVISVGLSQFIKQSVVSVLTCLISLICGCISSIELFMNINKNQEIELDAYRGFTSLSVKLSSTLKLERENRDTHGIQFLTTVISEYNRLFENSLVLISDIDDKLINLNDVCEKKSTYNPLTLFSPRKKPSVIEVKEEVKETELDKIF